MIKKVMNLLEVRKIMALVVILLFSALSLMDKLDVSFVQSVIISVISFYFGKTTSINEKGDAK